MRNKYAKRFMALLNKGHQNEDKRTEAAQHKDTAAKFLYQINILNHPDYLHDQDAQMSALLQAFKYLKNLGAQDELADEDILPFFWEAASLSRKYQSETFLVCLGDFLALQSGHSRAGQIISLVGNIAIFQDGIWH